MGVAKNITRQTLATMTTGFQTIFNNAMKEATPSWSRIATKVNSSTAIETYAWLGQIPGMKEWIDERFIKRLELEAYTLKNRKFEDTIAVSRESIEDDQLGVYSMAFSGMGAAVAAHPDELVFEALKKGMEAACYDGQNFFDEDHPVMVDGKETSVSNFQDGGEADTWYLMATKKAVKPIIYQERVAAEMVSHTDPAASDHIFNKDEVLYGARSRGAAGYGYWQTAFASKAPLTPENFAAARAAMSSLKGDQGRSLNIVGDMIVVPPNLETAADEVVNMQRTTGGKDNPLYKKAEVFMTPWLA